MTQTTPTIGHAALPNDANDPNGDAGACPRVDQAVPVPSDAAGHALQRRMLEATARAATKHELLTALLDATSLGDRIERAVYVTRADSGEWSPIACVGTVVDDEPLTAVVASACTSGTVEVRRLMAPARTLIAAPIAIRRAAPEAIAISVSGDAPNDATLSIQLVASHLVLWHVMHAGRDDQADAQDAAALVELFQRMLEAGDREHAYRRMCSELKEHLRCEMVAFGLVTGAGHCRLREISAMADFDRHSIVAKAMEAAMDEASIRDEITSWPPLGKSTAGGPSAHSIICHQHLAENHRLTQVTTVPLKGSDGDLVGVLLFSGTQDRDWSNRFLSAASGPLGTVVDAWNQRLQGRSSVSAIKRLLQSGRTLAILGVVALLVAAMFVPVPHRIKADCRVEPVTRRFVAAPFESVLERCLVKPGEAVRKGQVLARLDGRDLRLKRSSVIADREQASKRRDAAQASRQYSQQRIEQLEVERLDAELQLLERRAENLEIRSPIDGVIASGDLERTEGAPLSFGESLFEVAPLDEMVVELAVDGSDIAHVEVDQSIQLRLNAYPDKKWVSFVQRIQPRAEIYDDANVFVVEGSLINQDGLLRPGMKGRAKIRANQRPLGWVLFHKPWEFLAKRLCW